MNAYAMNPYQGGSRRSHFIPQTDHDEPTTTLVPRYRPIHRLDVLARAFSTEVTTHCGAGESDPELVIKQPIFPYSQSKAA